MATKKQQDSKGAETGAAKEKRKSAASDTAPSKKATPGKAKGGLAQPVTPSPELAEVVGKEKQPRSQIVSRIWDYIRKHDLQDPADKRTIVADDKLKAVFGKDKATMFEMNSHISRHVAK
jgi:chromatin remodeling complex protein RSC6